MRRAFLLKCCTSHNTLCYFTFENNFIYVAGLTVQINAGVVLFKRDRRAERTHGSSAASMSHSSVRKDIVLTYINIEIVIMTNVRDT